MKNKGKLNLHAFVKIKFHNHFHALATDGFFIPTGTFNVIPKTGLQPLGEIIP